MSGPWAFLLPAVSSQPRQQGEEFRAPVCIPDSCADDSIWSCNTGRHRLVWEREEKQEVSRAREGRTMEERGRVTRVQMEGRAETRLRVMLGDEGPGRGRMPAAQLLAS